MLGAGRDIVDVQHGVSMKDIALKVAAKRGVSLGEMVSPSRVQPVSHARQEAMARIHATGRYSLNQIGHFFGDRDHATVWHAVKAAAKRREAEP